MTWNGIVTKKHKYYLKELEISNNIEAYMQSLVTRKTLESTFLNHRCRDNNQDKALELKVTLKAQPGNKQSVGRAVPVKTEI